MTNEILLDIIEQMYYNISGRCFEVGDTIYPVDVISMCSANGDIRPLRLRMEDEEHQLLRIDIEEIISSKQKITR